MFAMVKKRFNIESVPLKLILFSLYKLLHQNVTIFNGGNRRILFIVGCQRSGSSILNRVFTRDLNSKVFRESSRLSSQDPNGLRLDPVQLLRRRFLRVKAPLIVLKPMVESHNVSKLLDHFSEGRALWLYRHYKDVASSNLRAFGINNGVDDLRPIVQDEQSNWRSEKVSTETRSMILEYFSEDMNPYDAAALFWVVRNQSFFDQKLDKNSKVMMVKYERLVKSPSDMIKKIYDFLELLYPGDSMVQEVHSQSISKGKAVELSPSVEKMCDEMWNRLNSCDQYRVEK